MLKSPTVQPARLNEPGKLDEDLAALDSLGGRTASPTEAPADARTNLDKFLKANFGTPAEPKIAGDSAVSALAESIGLSPQSLTEGGKLFRKHCQQCHGLSGEGRGPSGLWVNPYPRDFRRGAFKFTTTGEGQKPRKADILRTLEFGLKGTAMPAFGLLPENERELLASYVMFLSVRGQTEYQTLAAQFGAGDASQPPGERVRPILEEWERASQTPATPVAPDDGEPGSPSHNDAVRRGFAIFTAKLENACITCHGDFGRKPVLRYDVWGTVAKPNDLTVNNGQKRGSAPEELFARVRNGIQAVGMPAHPNLTERQVWDLVRFVQSAPYPVRLPEDVRAAVWPRP